MNEFTVEQLFNLIDCRTQVKIIGHKHRNFEGFDKIFTADYIKSNDLLYSEIKNQKISEITALGYLKIEISISDIGIVIVRNHERKKEEKI